jgi:hypothetical protein
MPPTNPLAAVVAAESLTGEVGGSRRRLPWAAVDCPPDDPAPPRRPRPRRFPRLRAAVRPRTDAA